LSGPGPGPLVEASFLGPRILTVSITNAEGGSGLVTLDPPSLDLSSICDGAGQAGVFTCTFRYPANAGVTLGALAAPGSGFVGWSGSGCLGTGTCQAQLPGSGPGPVVEATFNGPRTLSLSLASVRGGHGALLLAPAALSGAESCVLPAGVPSAACAFAYAPEAAVTVTPVPAPGSIVSAMGGACPASGPCVVTMSAAASVTATFEVPNAPPAASAGGPYAGLRGQSIAFDGSGSSDPEGQALTYAWTFSDGGAASGANPTHAFAALGVHTATLVVSDGLLASPPSSTTVTITNALPAVALTSPADGSTHPASGSIALAASALDPEGPVARVAFYAGATLVGEAFAPPFTAAWPGAAPGTYVLTAQATDGDGATTTSLPRTIVVSPLPTVALTAPANGAVFVAPASLTLAASAADDGLVVRVDFYRGATLLGSDSTSPYTFAWTGVAAGRYVLTARAVDDAGGVAMSAPVTVDVVTALSPAADSYVRDGSSAGSNFGSGTALETRVGSTNNNRWTYLRFNIASVPTVQAARLRLFGNLTSTTGTAVQARAFSSTNVAWSETGITWNNKPAAGTTVHAAVPLVTTSTTARWYEWDLTAFLQAEKAAGRTAVTIVLKNDVATTPQATFQSRQASSNRPELRITP
jgi:PKD repeat protein